VRANTGGSASWAHDGGSDPPTLTDDEGKIKSNQTPLIPEKPIN
jgi:hypothetical protein